MVSILSLWLPILVSAVAVFFVSWIIHMLLPYHRNDFDKLPDEEAVMDALRGFDLPEGDYHFPHCAGPKEMASPEFKEKMKKGPVGLVTVMKSGPPTMGKELVQWFVYSVIVSIFAAYISGQALAPGAHYLKVFQLAGCVAFTGYALALVQNAIWFKRKWSSTLKSMFDGLVYGLVTAGVFGWLWPGI